MQEIAEPCAAASPKAALRGAAERTAVVKAAICQPSARFRHHIEGFTLIELLVTMSIFGILVAAGGLGLRAYSDAQAEKGTANGIVSLLRTVSQEAQSEGRTYCVSVDSATTWSVWRYSCDPSWSSGSTQAAVVGTGLKPQGSAYVAQVAFTTPTLVGLANGCPAGAGRCIYFYPRGISSAGQLDVHRSGTSKVYAVSVEGLTSRAYLG
jgi:prepilin-type N-terminal cleavage/methylation domain-containing protein